MEESVNLIRVVYKSFLFVIFFVLFLILNSIVTIVFRSLSSRLFFTTKITTFLLKLSLAVFNVDVKVIDETGSMRGSGFLMVSNHVSYLDIFSIASVMNTVFVASVDGIERNFLMGTAAKLGGGIFVERKTRSRIKQDVESTEKILNSGYNVVLFPESTTSNGEKVLPFRSSLFESAVNAKADIVPAYIAYTELNGTPVNRTNRDNVFYYGSAEFFPHLFNMMKQRSITLEIRFLDSIAYDPEINRKELCEKAYKRITETKMILDMNKEG